MSMLHSLLIYPLQYLNRVDDSFRREPGQGNVEDLRSRDFRKDLEDREKDGTKAVAPAARRVESVAKRPKLDQVPAASLDADDPIEGDSSDSDDSDDDTAALLAELDRIKKERAIEQAKKVILCFWWIIVVLNSSCSMLFYVLGSGKTSGRRTY